MSATTRGLRQSDPMDRAAVTPRELLDALPLPHNRLAILAVDGGGGSGKSTLAALLAAAASHAAVVHTDDIAWHHSMFEWSEALVTGVLAPASTGAEVEYRPPGWIAKDRPGAVTVPAGTRLLIVEGVGASRADLAPWLDAAIWVDTDPDLAKQRGLARDLAEGVNGDTLQEAETFWDEWMVAELEFLGRDRPWERANAVVNGSKVPDGEGNLSVRFR